MKIGFHIPFSGNLKRLESRVIKTRGNAFQFFSRSMRGGRLPELKEKQVQNYYNFLFERKISNIIMHAPYSFKNISTISSNIAVPNPEAVDEILRDLEYANLVHAKYYVLNAGYAKELEKSESIEVFKTQLYEVLSRTSWKGKILVRNMSGGGSEIASDLMDWNSIISIHERVGGALDFGRAFSYGYSFLKEDDANTLLHLINAQIGWDKIPIIYINDSNRFSGSKRDDAAPLGDGIIGFHGYSNLLKDRGLKDKIWVVENQPEIYYYDRSIDFLKKFHAN